MPGRRLVVPLVASLLAGCSAVHEPRGLLGRLWHLEVGPDYHRPPVETPVAFRNQVEPAEAASFADLPWWSVFDDPILQGLIGDALAHNYDLATAVARVEEARAEVGVAAAQLYPQAGYSGTAEREKAFVIDSTGNRTLNVFSGVLSVAWEIDVWGRIRRSTEAARAQYLATDDARRGVMLTLVSDVATAYFQLLEFDRELEIAHESTIAYQKTLDLFRTSYEHGTDTRISVDRASAALEGSHAQVAALERAILQQEDAISVLVGSTPEDIPRGVPLAAQTQPRTPPGLTTDLLKRRPDIRQSENAMVAANAEVGVAVANFFPTVGLSALYGGEGPRVGDVVKNSFSVWNIAANVAGPLFQGGRLYETYRQRQAFWDESIAQYRGIVIQAFREVADALAAESRLGRQQQALARQVKALDDAVQLSLVRYNMGYAFYFEVLEAQQQLYPAEDALAQTQRDQLLAVVDLYKALGGGWQTAGQTDRGSSG